ILEDVILFFSRSTPNLVMVIHAMDHINKILSSQSLPAPSNPSIHIYLGLANKTLNQYYRLTDSSEVYRIAMILHPRHKINYCKAASWEPEWIDTTEENIRAEFAQLYASA
ncbi:hypothetical protein FA95DRAFT_1505844, partial [Auriscalpium vulgare]